MNKILIENVKNDFYLSRDRFLLLGLVIKYGILITPPLLTCSTVSIYVIFSGGVARYAGGVHQAVQVHRRLAPGQSQHSTVQCKV